MRLRNLALLGVAAAVLAPFAQAALERSVYRQPWQKPRPGFSSRVESCAMPRPSNWVVLDDFVAEIDGQVRRLDWWGTLIDPEQANRPFHIAIYSDQNCLPSQKLFETCVVPKVRFVDFDCENQPVYRFRTPLPTFDVSAGEHLWLEIAADEEASVQPGADVFRWSAHAPIEHCPALGRDAAGNFVRPLVDRCKDQPVDLAFALVIVKP